MKKDYKYDPEDLESLLMHKTFDELYPEEKSFVLKHLDGSEEYAEMRKTLLLVQREMQDGEGIEARPEIKEKLMARFQSERKGGFLIWLNQLFSSLERNRYRWAIPLSAAGVALLAWFFILDEAPPMGQMADKVEKKELQTKKEGMKRVSISDELEEEKIESEIVEPPAEDTKLDESQVEILAETTSAKEAQEELIAEEESVEFESESLADLSIDDQPELETFEEELKNDPINNADTEPVSNQGITNNQGVTNNSAIRKVVSRSAEAFTATNTDLFEPSNLARPNAEAYTGIMDSFFTAY